VSRGRGPPAAACGRESPSEARCNVAAASPAKSQHACRPAKRLHRTEHLRMVIVPWRSLCQSQKSAIGAPRSVRDIPAS
jgi:hypothetical protein